MFGSDQIIRVSVEAVETADFLDAEQRRDIFYNNAARFFRLSQAEIETDITVGNRKDRWWYPTDGWSRRGLCWFPAPT